MKCMFSVVVTVQVGHRMALQLFFSLLNSFIQQLLQVGQRHRGIYLAIGFTGESLESGPASGRTATRPLAQPDTGPIRSITDKFI